MNSAIYTCRKDISISIHVSKMKTAMKIEEKHFLLTDVTAESNMHVPFAEKKRDMWADRGINDPCPKNNLHTWL